MTCKEALKIKFDLSDAESDLLDEKTSETLYFYLDAYGYENQKGWNYPHGRHLWELITPYGETADIFFNTDGNEVLLVEYPSDRKYFIDSQTKFVHKIRVDYIKTSDGKNLLYTDSDFNKTVYVEEKEVRPYLSAFHKELPIDTDSATLFSRYLTDDEPEYMKLLNTKDMAFRLREATDEKEL